MATVRTYVKGQTNWAAAGTWGGTAPSGWHATDDSVLMAEGGPVALTNLNAITAASKTLVNFTVRPGCTTSIGDKAGSLSVAWSGIFDYAGGGREVWLAGSGADLVWRPSAGGALVGTGLTLTGTLTVLGGSASIGAGDVLVDVRAGGFGQVDIAASNAADTVRHITQHGRSRVNCRREATGTVEVPAGCEFVYDGGNTSGGPTVHLCGGRVTWISGDLTLKGDAGVFDRSGLKPGYDLTITATPDLVEVRGPVAPDTDTRTNVGAGAAVQNV